MKPPLEKINDLVELAQQDSEEGRTAAHLALKLMRRHGFVVTMARHEGGYAHDAAPSADGRRSAAPRPPAPSAQPSPQRSKKVQEALVIAIDETKKFFQTLDVLPRDVPTSGVQLMPAEGAGTCATCSRRYRRGEFVSRRRPHRCVRCVL